MTTSIQQRATKVAQLKNDLKLHPMCYHLYDEPGVYRVIFPRGYRLDGIQCDKSIGKAAALRRLIKRAEEEWQYDLKEVIG